MNVEWKVTMEPVEGNTSGTDEKNEGGVVVYLQNVSGSPTEKREVSRVAYNRKNGSQPKVGFDKALIKEVEKARTTATMINSLQSEFEAAKKAADALRVKAVTATPSGGRTALR